jgi:hypothetical protein
VREIRTLRAMWRALETGPRRILNGHEEGNLGHKPRRNLRAAAPALDPTALQLTVEKQWTWWRVLLPVWAVLGHNLLYISVGFVWLTLFDDGVTEDEIVIRERDHTYGYQLAALLCFAIFADNVLRRIEGAGQTVGFWLSSGRWELISVFGILSVALQLLFWSEVVPPAKHRHRSH